jgi:hypothetical protein
VKGSPGGGGGGGCDVGIILSNIDQDASRLWLLRSGTSLWTDIVLVIVISMDIVF